MIFELFLALLAIGVAAALAAGLHDAVAVHLAPRAGAHLRGSDTRTAAVLRVLAEPFGLDVRRSPAPRAARTAVPAPAARAVPRGGGQVVQPSLFPLPVRTRPSGDARPARRTTTHAA